MRRNFFRFGFVVSLLLMRVAIATSPEIVLTVPVETQLGFSDLREAHQVWLEMIRKANRTLDIEQFYISDEKGERLEPVLEAIKEAARRGVTVRLVVDAKFFKTYPEKVRELGAQKNIESRTVDFDSLGGVQHAKFFIVDSQELFVGSHNFDWRALKHIHEVGVRIEDRALSQKLLSVFNLDWSKATRVGTNQIAEGASRPFVPEENEAISFVASPARSMPTGVDDTLQNLLRLISSAKKRIQLQVMEYTTQPFHASGKVWKDLEKALVSAAKKGVSVEMLLDSASLKKGPADLQLLTKNKSIQVKIVRIPDWSGGKIDFARLIHSKYVVVDESQAWLGTENFSQGYFRDCRNVGFLFQDAKVVGDLDRIFSQLWNSSYAKTLEADLKSSQAQ